MAVALLVAAGALSACTLEEISLVDPEDVVVAEVYVQLSPGTELDRVTAFLHRTLGPGGESTPVPGARVVVTRADGLSLEMAETSIERCVVTTPVTGTGTCQWLSPTAAERLEPGDTVTLRIDLPDGGVMESQSVVPGDFALAGADLTCLLPADTSVTVSWSPSRGAWAYLNETLLRDVRTAFASKGITVDPADDPLYLLGLSISATDTTIVFPGEFGVFNRFELDQDIAVALQRGLPDGVRGDVSIAAADRNYVNWVRGGNFNPSGQVRIPSIRGDGTGVFGSTVIQRFTVATPGASGTPEATALPSCPGF